jgi:ubiquitin-activating enzyme E1
MSIDYERYDRQIRTFGAEASIKINSSNIAIIGLEKGLGTEVAKNLALCGINLYLFDDKYIVKDDLITGYFYSESDLYKKRNQVLSIKLKELNSNINIKLVNDLEQLFNADVIICINQKEKHIINYNNLCRFHNKKFISLKSSNNMGVIFVVAGESHLVKNISGENYEPVQILNIDIDGKVKTNGHDFQTGDIIMLTNLQGDNVEQFNKEFIIDSLTKFDFKLRNFKLENFKFINATAVYVDNPIIIKHNNYTEQINNPSMSFLSDENILKNYVHSDIEIISVNSIMGSLVASEAIKLVTNKYSPISQWFTWEDSKLNLELAKEKLTNSEIFIVGSGAIGCELLKNLAFLDVKKIKITDPDTIEKSNLSRQFLFRNKDVGKLKSEVASNTIKIMKPSVEIEYLAEKVGDDNIRFTNMCLENKNLTAVFNALDNINARRFMDNQCFNYNLPLFESGTMGIKGNTQPIIPFLTETYSNSNDPTNEKSFAVCTIKNFPNEIHHTIHWALDQFEFFNRAPKNIIKWLQNKNMKFNNDIDGIQTNNDIWLYTTKYNIQSYYECVIWAINMFYENFYNQIIQLLNNFPENTLTSEGTPFWSAGKRCPKPIMLDPNNKDHIEYINATTILLCRTVGINTNFTIEDLISIINKYNIPKFKPKNDLIIASNDSELNNETQIDNDIKELNLKSLINCAFSQDFEKDDDTNYHVKWINAASNLRATNYSIENIDFYTTKGIAGKIIPAVATTTSIVGGLITIEFIKYLCYNDIESFKSTFINLALNSFVSADPISAKDIEVAGLKFNIWHKFIETSDLTINNFIKKYSKLFDTTINMVAIGSSLIYADFLENDCNNKLFSEILNELELNINFKHNITICSDNEKISLPDIIIELNSK